MTFTTIKKILSEKIKIPEIPEILTTWLQN